MRETRGGSPLAGKDRLKPRGMTVPADEEHRRALAAEGRVLLAFTPDQPLTDWTCWGLD